MALVQRRSRRRLFRVRRGVVADTVGASVRHVAGAALVGEPHGVSDHRVEAGQVEWQCVERVALDEVLHERRVQLSLVESPLARGGAPRHEVEVDLLHRRPRRADCRQQRV